MGHLDRRAGLSLLGPLTQVSSPRTPPPSEGPWGSRGRAWASGGKGLSQLPGAGRWWRDSEAPGKAEGRAEHRATTQAHLGQVSEHPARR